MIDMPIWMGDRDQASCIDRENSGCIMDVT